MPTYGHPDVHLQESILSNTPNFDPSVSTAVFVAAHGRGPLEPNEVHSWSEFVRIYGGFPARTSLLPYSVFSYFNNGGSDAIILRVSGTGAAAATLELSDRSATPEPTLEVTASNPGEWGNTLAVTVESVGEDRFNLLVHLGGTSNANIVERFLDLSMDPASSRYVEAVVNSGRSGSAHIRVSDLESPTEDFGDARPAATETAAVLASGDNGETPTTEQMIDALADLEKINRIFLLNLPGVSEEAVIDAGLAHCASSGLGFMVIDSAPGMNPTEVSDYANSMASTSYGAVYYPWLNMRDPAGSGSGATRLLPPGGAVAGLITATDTRRGVWKAPAGIDARLGGAVSLERPLSSSDLTRLFTNNVNAVRHIAQVGMCVMGARTLKNSDADKFIPIRRTLIYLRQSLLERTRWAAFEPNDAVLWSDLQSNISQFLTGFWQEGGLQGATAAEAFFVRSDESLNTPDVVASGEVKVEVGVALRYPAEFVIISLSQWEGGNGQAEELTTIG